MLKANDYRTIVFDCDGVILNSNSVKTAAFYNVALKFGEDKASALKEYHVLNGGISRFAKFEWFQRTQLSKVNDQLFNELLEDYAHEVMEALKAAEVSESLEQLRLLSTSNWMVASGGLETELNKVFEFKGIQEFFDKGIFGSPTSKDDIVKNKVNDGSILFPALFIGDSRYDYEVAQEYGLDFLFLHEWSEFSDWKNYFKTKNVTISKNLDFLVTGEVSKEKEDD